MSQTSQEIIELYSKEEYPSEKQVLSLFDKYFDFRVRKEDRSSLMHYASAFGHAKVIRYLINKQVSVEEKNGSNWRPIHFAAVNGHIEVVRLLVEYGADLNAQVNENNFTPIHLASKEGQYEIVRYLLELGVYVNLETEKSKLTPLFVAITHRQVEVVRVLLEFGAELNAELIDGGNYLHLCTKGVLLTFEKYYKEVNKKNYDSSKVNLRPLSYIVDDDMIKIISMLIEKGVDVNGKNIHGNTPIQLAAKIDNSNLIKQIAMSGADVNVQDKDGWSPLHLASIYGNLENLRQLVLLGGNINLSDNLFWKPIHWAAKEGYYPLVRYLLFKHKDNGLSDADLHLLYSISKDEEMRSVIKNKVKDWNLN